MKVCLIGPKNSKDSMSIKTYAESNGVECKRIYMTDIYFEVSGLEFKAEHRKLDLMEYDVFLFRSVRDFFTEALLLAEFLEKQGKVVIDRVLANSRYLPILAKQKLSANKIPQLDSVHVNSIRSARDILMEIPHPILIKYKNNLGKTQVTISEDWTDSYDLARTNKDKEYLFKKYIDARSFDRVFIIGDNIVGAIKKNILDEEPKLYYSSKYQSEGHEANTEEKALALSAVKALDLEIASVDLVEHEGNLYVLDVNRAPKFSLLEKKTGINFAEYILKYCQSRLDE